MKLDSVRELKGEVIKKVITSLLGSVVRRGSLSVRARPLAALAGVVSTFAIGVIRRRGGGYALALRLQQRSLENSTLVEAVRAKAPREVQVRYIGRVVKRLPVPWYRREQRPLRLGCSMAHQLVTAGTLGVIVRSRADGTVLALSNNHVLADEGRATVGDAVLQASPLDNGTVPPSVVGSLHSFIPLSPTGANTVDAAVARLNAGLLYEAGEIRDIGPLTGVNPGPLHAGTHVQKVGRTTGLTFGRVAAFEVDNVVADFDTGPLRFDNQIEVESEDGTPFSQGGDSGAVVVDDGGRVVGLLFGGSDQGGSDGQGLTYLNPIQEVLDRLQVDLVT